MIYRAFGAAEAVETGIALAGLAAERGLVLLVGRDVSLAEACGAQGVHLPEKAVAQAALIRNRHPRWILTGAAHGADGLRAAETAALDAAFLSPVFPSRSPSAGAPLGLARFSALATGARVPVYALGGVNTANAASLLGSGAAGLAAVEALEPAQA